jgi:NADH-ubiquinone oxidoreductase chain 5
MRAPTPIRALVHSSTLVTAGIYLRIKYFNLLFCKSLLFLYLIGSLTVLTSGVLALIETDGKKVVALRTLNQLGIMVVNLALGNSRFVFLHLLTHAFFKRIIFMQLGYFIHLRSSIQESRNYSLLYKGNSFNILLLLVRILNLCGLIFTRGFTSKERILIIALFSFRSKISIGLVLIRSSLSSFYSVRLIRILLSSGCTKLVLNGASILVGLGRALLFFGSLRFG